MPRFDSVRGHFFILFSMPDAFLEHFWRFWESMMTLSHYLAMQESNQVDSDEINSDDESFACSDFQSE